MWETWVATVRRDSISRAAISGFDNPSWTNAAILISVAVRLSQPLFARRRLACGPLRHTAPRRRAAGGRRDRAGQGNTTRLPADAGSPIRRRARQRAPRAPA